MRTKLILLFIITIILAWFVFNRYYDNIDDEVVTLEPIKEKIIKQSDSPKTDKIDSKAQSTVNKNVLKKKPSIEPTIDAALTFSSDPVVNAYTTFKNNEFCYSQLENKNNESVYLRGFLQRLDKNQAEYFENYINYCLDLDKKHPEYSLTNKDEILSKMKQAKANTLWGKIIKKEVEISTLSQTDVQNLLKSNDINILQEAPQYLETHYQEVIHWDLESYLGNHDYDYVKYIRQLAHQMYLCNLGAECHPHSSIMANLCYQNISACGIGFVDYVNNILTPGQQADIQLALTYLSSQYQ